MGEQLSTDGVIRDIPYKERIPTALEKEAAARYNALNRHERRAFDARAKKMLKAHRK